MIVFILPNYVYVALKGGRLHCVILLNKEDIDGNLLLRQAFGAFESLLNSCL